MQKAQIPAVGVKICANLVQRAKELYSPWSRGTLGAPQVTVMNGNRHGLQVGVLLVTLVVMAGSAYASDRGETLQAINWVENPRNSMKVGPRGELGPYQFRPATWRMYTNKPFELAAQREHADEVAVLHYEWLKRGLQGAGIEPTPYTIALAWNAGLGQVINDRVPPATYAYAEQVANLAASFKAERLATAR